MTKPAIFRRPRIGAVVLAALAVAAFAACGRSGRLGRPALGPAPAPESGAPAAAPPPAPAAGEKAAAEAARVRSEAGAPIPPAEKKAVAEAAIDPGQARDKAAAALDEALSRYQESKQARERDDLDAALQSLDAAYESLLKAEVEPDSALAREKADLRLLIVQRIREIGAARRAPIADNHKSIPLFVNKWVQRELDSFRGPERTFFLEAYRRSGFYRDGIQAELRKAGLPEELVWLAMIESWFLPRALSSARALGMWQFISSTGLFYGLARDRLVDERMDPFKSTRAAIAYLTDLHGMFGDWSTALAAYNCGPGFVQRCINTQKTSYLDDFWDLFARLPYQTARYVPRFIAAVLIVKDPARFGMTLPEPYPALVFETAAVSKPAKLSAWAAALDVEEAELVFLNPELRVYATPSRAYPLRVPVGAAARAAAAAEGLPRWEPPAETVTSFYTVRSGDSLSAIAARFGTTVAALQKMNGMRSASLVVGQRLRVPGRG